MKRSKLLISIVILCTFALAFAGCGGGNESASNEEAATETAAEGEGEGEGAGTADAIKIGVILPFSGLTATVGADVRNGLELAINEINEAGGVSSMGGAKFELIFADSKGDPKTGMSEAERLILKEEVAVLMGAYHSSVTFTASEIAEKYQCPFLTLVAVADDITNRGFKYTFRINARSSDCTKLPPEFVTRLGETTGVKAKTVAIIYEDSEWGQTNAAQWREGLAAQNLEIVLDESYPASTTDMVPLVTKVKNVKPDLLFSAIMVSDGILLAQTLDQMDVNLMGWFGGGSGELDVSYVPAVGDIADGMFSPTGACDDMLDTKVGLKELNEAFIAKYGGDSISNGAAVAYCNGYVLLDVFERAGTTDHEAIRQAFVDTDIQGGKAVSGMTMDRIVFGPDGHNSESFIVMVQLSGGKWKVAYPENLVKPDFTVKWPLGEI